MGLQKRAALRVEIDRRKFLSSSRVGCVHKVSHDGALDRTVIDIQTKQLFHRSFGELKSKMGTRHMRVRATLQIGTSSSLRSRATSGETLLPKQCNRRNPSFQLPALPPESPDAAPRRSMH